MKKAAIGALLVGLSVTAWAGRQHPPLPVGNVNIDTDARWAYGAMGNARSSPNDFEEILCGTFHTTGAILGYCNFSNEKQFAMCVTDDPSLVAAIQSMNGDDYVSVTWDEATRCTVIVIDHDSAHAPKAH
jgi:hypothetical protein